jgi:tetratricopeptide (TPR) repeat protein
MAVDFKNKADGLLREGVYRLSQGEYEAAEAVLRRAVELNPQLPAAHQQLGRTLSYRAAEMNEGNGKIELLDEAEASVKQASELQEKPTPGTLHDLAWIYDERGGVENITRAVELYRQALDQFGRVESPDNDLTPVYYNLACSLVKLGPDHLGEALDTISHVFEDPWRGDAWRFAERDPDLEELRTSPLTAEKFKQLVVKAQARSKAP